MDCLAIAHSVPSAASIAAFVTVTYDLGPVADCRLHTRGVNDTYDLRCGTARYVLRCYRAGWRRLDDIGFELEALLHLQRKGVPVAAPVMRCDGEYVGRIDCPEGPRATVLFTYAEGRLVAMVEESHHYGCALASIHNATDDFTSSTEHFRLDLRHLLDEPLPLILPFLAARPTDRDYLAELAGRLRLQIERVGAGLSVGFCRGDAWGGNAHVLDDTVTFFDFDCCGEGWLSYDLAVFLWDQASGDHPDRSAHCAAILAGYQTQRAIRPADRDAIPLFVLARQIWHMGVHAAGVDHWGSGWLDDSYFDRRMRRLRQWEASKLRDLLPEHGEP